MNAVTEDAPPPMTRVVLSIVTFLILMGGTGLAAKWLGVTGPAMVVLLVPGFLALWWMIVECRRRAKARGAMTPAASAYVRRVLPLSAAYVVLLIAAIYLQQTYRPEGVALYALAVASALPLVGFIWAMARLLIEEKDEFQRAMTAQRMLIATGFMLVVATIWGFLEDFGVAPHAPAYFAFIIWCVGLGLAGAVRDFIK